MIFFDYNKINGENITHEKTFDGERSFNKDSKKIFGSCCCARNSTRFGASA